jgi:DNA-binding SARP family transcriptional activator
VCVRFAILGPVELRDGERRTPVGSAQQVTLLAFLLLHRNRAVSIDQIHHALWTGRGRNGAAKRVQMAVVRLRESLERGAASGRALRTVGGGYLLDVAAGELDADLFEARLT